MNGAAMNCRQDPGLRPQHRDPGSLHNPGYHLQINRQQNLPPQNSKTLNYPSFSSNCQVEGYYNNSHYYESRQSVEEMEDPRFQRSRAIRRRREPIDLPVPDFEVDEHSVNASIPGSKTLDLDTRIGLLIKSKALAGMHPIFSDLNDSEESDSDLDDPLLSRPKSKFRKANIQPTQREMEMPVRESFDDPEKPWSRPPSPFLSRATYLFWFNKAIEIKQQAKAQEQALLEQATKRLTQDQASSSLLTNQPDLPQKRPVPKNLVDEISKEIKEVIKQEFIREVIENMAFNTLDDWWEKQNQEEKFELEDLKIVNLNKSSENQEDLILGNLESQGSTSPKMPFPWEKETKDLIKHQKHDDLKSTCFVEEMPVCQASSGNSDESFHGTNSVLQDSIMTSDNSTGITKEHQETLSETIGSEEVKKSCEMKCQKVNSTLVKCFDNEIDNCTSSKHIRAHSEGLPNLPLETNTFEPEVLEKKSKRSQHFHSNKYDFQDGNMGEKLVIVKDILDFIFNNVNTIVMKRDSNTHLKENENLASNLATSFDSPLTEKVKLDPSEDVPNIIL